MTFDPIRREELRIMGYADIAHDGADSSLERMGKLIAHDGVLQVSRGQQEVQQGDCLVEYEDGTTEIFTSAEFETLDWVLMPPEATEVDAAEPVPLAQPVGLLQQQPDEEATSDA